MASEKVTAMIEEIKAMSVLELSELVHEIEDVFGVSAAAAVAAAPRGFLIWCGRWDLNPHVYGWTQAPQACLSTDSSTPAYALFKRMSYYNRKARNVNSKFSTQVDFFIFPSAAISAAVPAPEQPPESQALR